MAMCHFSQVKNTDWLIDWLALRGNSYLLKLSFFLVFHYISLFITIYYDK